MRPLKAFQVTSAGPSRAHCAPTSDLRVIINDVRVRVNDEENCLELCFLSCTLISALRGIRIAMNPSPGDAHHIR